MNEEIIKELSRITEEEQRILDGDREVNLMLYESRKKDIAEYDAGRLLEEGRLITIRKHTRFIAFPAHRHNYVEVIYMCRGETRHRINGQEILLKEGEILFLNQNAVQEIEPAGAGDLAVNFIILPEFFDAILPMISAVENPLHTFVLRCIRGEQTDNCCLHFKVSGILPIQNLLENLIWTMIHHMPYKRTVNQMTMGLLLMQLMDHIENVETASDDDGQKLMFSILNYVETEYREGSLESLALSLHYDVYWLSREIKRRTGLTFTELVQNKRLSQAVYLLENTGLTIAEIGSRVGYENLSYFYRIFQKRYGITPRKYRSNL